MRPGIVTMNSSKLLQVLVLLTLNSFSAIAAEEAPCRTWKLNKTKENLELYVTGSKGSTKNVVVKRGSEIILQLTGLYEVPQFTTEECKSRNENELFSNVNFDEIQDLVLPNELGAHATDYPVFIFVASSRKFQEITEFETTQNLFVDQKNKTIRVGDGKYCYVRYITYRWRNRNLERFEEEIVENFQVPDRPEALYCVTTIL